MILGMSFEMLSQIGNFFAKNGNLNLRRPGISLMSTIGVYNLSLLLYCK